MTDEAKQLPHNPPVPGAPCLRCGIKLSSKTAYLPCFVEGDDLKTWVARHSDALIDSHGYVPDLLIDMAERMAASTTTDDKEEKLQHWTRLALVIGFNELAKESKSLGEKVFFRMVRDGAEKEYLSHGGAAIHHLPQEGDETVLVIDLSGAPSIVFQTRDIERMRAAVAEHDAKTIERTPEGRINNCAIENGEDASQCQVCNGVCPDNHRRSKERATS